MTTITNHKRLFIPVALLALLVMGAFFVFGQAGTPQVVSADTNIFIQNLPGGGGYGQHGS